MDAQSLRRRLPRDKSDVAAARALIALGHPALEPIHAEMLAWLKVVDSPVAVAMADYFAGLGASAVPVVREALRGRNDTLRYAVVRDVVARWPAPAVEGVKDELLRLASNAGAYGTDLFALRLLVVHRLAERDWLAQWARFKSARLRTLLAQAEEIERLLPD